MQPFQFCAENPGLIFILTILWHLWIAIGLVIICIELHAHNSREEKREYRREFQDQRQDRYAVAGAPASPRGQRPPDDPEARYMSKP
jgi:hypothetical protein